MERRVHFLGPVAFLIFFSLALGPLQQVTGSDNIPFWSDSEVDGLELVPEEPVGKRGVFDPAASTISGRLMLNGKGG